MTAPLMYEPRDDSAADLPLIAVDTDTWVDLHFDPRLTIERDPVLGEVRVVGDVSFVLAEAVCDVA